MLKTQNDQKQSPHANEDLSWRVITKVWGYKFGRVLSSKSSWRLKGSKNSEN